MAYYFLGHPVESEHAEQCHGHYHAAACVGLHLTQITGENGDVLTLYSMPRVYSDNILLFDTNFILLMEKVQIGQDLTELSPSFQV